MTIEKALEILGAVSALATVIASVLPKGSKAAVFLTRLSAIDFRGHVASSTVAK